MDMQNKEKLFLDSYWNIYKKILFGGYFDSDLINIKNQILQTNKLGGKLYFYGNGASASLSSHAATDFSKQAKIQALAMNDHNLITAFSNDYGYSKWVEKSIEIYVNKDDLIFFISVSGESENLKNGLIYAKNNGIKTISFTGCKPENFLKSNSDLNLWVDSNSYNIVESIHTICVTALIDLIIGKSSYKVN